VKAAKSTKAAKATKAVKATKATKATKAIQASGATKAAKATRTARAGKAAGAVATGDAAGATNTTRAAKASRGGSNRSADTGDARPGPAPEALNDPMTFLTFVADHPVGSIFDGTVVSFTSHGAHIDVGGMLCHVPLRRLADPPPQKARQVLTKEETRPFVLLSLDAARRRAELGVPGVGE
jgi:hypothetical protein